MYGITETTVHVTYRALGTADAALGSRIGRPLPDLGLYLLDGNLEPVALGSPGEIVVGGAGVAMGYLNRPELTAERFVPDPFGSVAGARLYRSGDLARHRADGDLEVLGRIDRQVKVRGFRIELGEIEAALRQSAAVQEAVVLVRGGAAEERRLVACVVRGAGEEPPPAWPAALRESLAAALPNYMVPSRILALPVLPLTANGKLDRDALERAVDQAEAADADAGVGSNARSAGNSLPRTALELFLVELFGRALQRERVGLDDDFFALGGNSILGAVLINRLQEEVGEVVHVVTIFDAPTVRQLAAHLAAEHAGAVARRWPDDSVEAAGGSVHRRVGEAAVMKFRALIQPLAPAPAGSAGKNPPAVFVLSPPRSGSTLLRVMLGGHPRLFAPPELELLSFNTLAERSAAFSGRDRFWLEGVVRAVMEIRGCGAEEATAMLAQAEGAGLSTRQLYGRLQEWLGPRMLVDKTPSYALDAAILGRAEESFERPLYLHLVRHPHGMIRSFEEAKLDQIFFRREHPFGRRELAELIWRVSQENILGFLREVPAERQHRVCFEELVDRPEEVLSGICAFLGIPYEPAMARPYEGRRERMTDGIHAESRMLGDVKFHQHRGVERETAERWRGELAEDFLGEGTWEVAEALGYEREDRRGLTRIVAGRWRAGEPLPLSFAQERLWFLDQLDPGNPTYNIPLALALDGGLEVAALAASLGEIVRRHASLRTTFAAAEGHPVQVIAPASGSFLTLVDLDGLPPAAGEAEARRLGREAALRPFDLRRGPLMRAALVRLAAESHVALLNLHHIVADGWSMGVLMAELGTLYAAAVANARSPLPELPIQYADFTLWQRRQLSGDALEREIVHWRGTLAGIAPLELPTDRPRPAVQTFRGGGVRTALPAPLAANLAEIGRRQGLTLFMTLLATTVAVLARHAGQDDVAVGTAVANRGRAEVEGLIGFFVNTLVLRGDCSGDPSFATLLGRVRATALSAFAHQDLPFEKIVEELNPRRDPSRTPLFQVMFTLQEWGSEEVSLPGLRSRRIDPAGGLAKFDLSVGFGEAEHGLGGSWGFNRDLFDATTIARLAAHFEVLAAGAASRPEQPLSALPLLTAGERAQLLREWNDGVTIYPRGETIHTLFAARVTQQPEAVALEFGGETITYRELAVRAAGVAHRLRRLSVGPEVMVGLCLPRSTAMVVATLGVLQAGGAYVPLDLGHPRERLALLLADVGARVVVTEGRFLAQLPETAAAVLCLDRLDGPGAAPARVATPRGGSPLEAAPQNLAYVIYTSGSTGLPKGVAVPHRGVVRLVRETDFAQLGPDDRVAQISNTAFDAATFELWGALLNGGRLVGITKEVALAPQQLAAEIAERRISALFLTSSLFGEVAREAPEAFAAVRFLLVGGEAVEPAAARRVLAAVPPARLLNGYGPTESTTFTACHRIAEVAPDALSLPIGRPIANTTVHLLDGAGNPVPIGVVGELFIGGDGLARGYFGRPELTAERFVPDAVSGAFGARLYRSGDRVRALPDGAIDFLGRTDGQVKVRGFRIELGEIEAVLAGHPLVERAAVIVRGEGAGERRLAAFYVCEAAIPTPAELRAFLRAKLPDYMVPGAFIRLGALPLNANGKVDRRALAESRGARGRGRGPCGAADRGRGGDRRLLERSAGARTGRSRGRLLRPGWALPARRAGRLARGADVPGEAAVAAAVRQTDRRRPRRGGGRRGGQARAGREDRSRPAAGQGDLGRAASGGAGRH